MLKDPMTGADIDGEVTLSPNHDLQKEIANWCEANGYPFSPEPWAVPGMQAVSLPPKQKPIPEHRQRHPVLTHLWAILKAMRSLGPS